MTKATHAAADAVAIPLSRLDFQLPHHGQLVKPVTRSYPM